MSVPTYDQLMLPLLQYADDSRDHHIRQASDDIAEFLELSEEEVNELLPSGKKTKFYDRIHWAKTYLIKARLLESTGRGMFQITSRGLDFLKRQPEYIDRNTLMQFPEFIEFQSRSNSTSVIADSRENVEDETPRELIHSIYQNLHKELADELIDYVLDSSPKFFERMVVELLLNMGYGGALGSGQDTRISNDGGIDGIIQEDKLGLDKIYIQAKRWARDRCVGRPDVQGFAGSLAGEAASKGVFITTSYFSKSATEYADRVPNLKIILIDGEQLARLMIEHNIGVSVEQTYSIKRVDRDYFSVD